MTCSAARRSRSRRAPIVLLGMMMPMRQVLQMPLEYQFVHSDNQVAYLRPLLRQVAPVSRRMPSSCLRKSYRASQRSSDC